MRGLNQPFLIVLSTVKQFRSLHIGGIGIIYENGIAILDSVNDGPGKFLGYGRATEAPAQEAFGADHALIGIFRAVHHDGPGEGHVIDTGFYTLEPQGIPVGSHIRALSDIESKGTFVGGGFVGETPGELLSGVPAMGYYGMEEDALLFQVHHVKPLLTGGFREIHDGQDTVFADQLSLPQRGEPLHGRQESLIGQTLVVQTDRIEQHAGCAGCLGQCSRRCRREDGEWITVYRKIAALGCNGHRDGEA